ncbi:hypothetical protein [Francisella tularensis]|uniref:hypothetical protein n=1 Tax=Francisella tularensis TaxID=263 RepID=UPI0039A10C7F
MPSQDLLKDIKNTQVLADKAYFSEENLKFISENGNTAIILVKENYTRDHRIDWHIYKDRHLIEKFSLKLSISEEFFLGLIKLALLF